VETEKNNNSQTQNFEEKAGDELSSEANYSSSLMEGNQGEILVVDDNPEILESIGFLLEATGFGVKCASSAIEALCILENSQPDLILSDVKMDGIDGFEFQRMVRQNEELYQVPFIFLSALSDPLEIRKGKSSGCDDYLLKPFQPDDLIAVVEGKLFTSRKRRSFNQKELNKYCRGVIERLSHEFRTPLVAINAGAEILQMKLESSDDSQLKSLSDSILRGGQRLQRLVEDFMTLQSIESGKARELFQAHKKQERVADLVQRSTTHLLDFILPEETKINLNIDPSLDSDNFQVELLELQFVEILKRIIENSVKFAGIEKPIEISLRGDEQTISVLVRDYGPGLKDSDYNLAQELFGQISRTTKEQQGCGLGITISTWFAEINEGDLLFHRPDSGEGLIVEARFPRFSS